MFWQTNFWSAGPKFSLYQNFCDRYNMMTITEQQATLFACEEGLTTMFLSPSLLAGNKVADDQTV